MFLNCLTIIYSETLPKDHDYIISGGLGSSVIYKQRFVTPNPQTAESFYTIYGENQQKLHDLCVETQFMLKANTYVCKIGLNTKNWYRLKKDVPIKIVCATLMINHNKDHLFAFRNPSSFQINITNGTNTRTNLFCELLCQKVDLTTSFQIYNDDVTQTHAAQCLVFEPQGIHLLQRNAIDQQFILSQPFEPISSETNSRNYRVASTQKYLLSLRALNACISGANDGSEEFKARFNFASNNKVIFLSDIEADRIDSEEIEKKIFNKSKNVFRRIIRWNDVVDKYLSENMSNDDFMAFWNDNYNLVNVVLENHHKAMHNTKDAKEMIKYLLHVPYLLSFYGEKYLHNFKGLDGQDGRSIVTYEFFNENFLEKWREELKDVSASDVRVTNIFVMVISEALNFVTNLTKNKRMFEEIFFNDAGVNKIEDTLDSIVKTAIEYFDNVDKNTQAKVQYFIGKAKIIYENNSTYLENKQSNENNHLKFAKEVMGLNEEVQAQMKIIEEKKIERRKNKKDAPVEKCEQQTNLIQKTITAEKTNIEALENKLFVGKELYEECNSIKEVLSEDDKNKIDALGTAITNLEEYIEKVKKKKMEKPEEIVEEEDVVSEESVIKEEEDMLQYVDIVDDKEKDKSKYKSKEDTKDKTKEDTEDKSKEDTEDKGINTGVIAAIVISLIVTLVGICVGVWYFFIKKKNAPQVEIEQPSSNNSGSFKDKRSRFNSKSEEIRKINVKPIYRNNY